VLSDGERDALEALVRKRTASQSLAERARIVLACAEDGGVAPLTAVASRTGVSRETARKWCVRFVEGRLGGLADAPGPAPAEDHRRAGRGGGHPGPDGEGARAGHALVDEDHGRRDRLSQSSVSRIWRAFGLKPHVVETWKLSTDPEFIAKVRDVVGL